MKRYIIVINLFTLSLVSSRAFPAIPKNARTSLRVGNCTDSDKNPSKCKSIQDIIQMEMIQRNIIRKLCKKDQNGQIKTSFFCDKLRNLTVTTTKKPPPTESVTPQPVFMKFKEIISFSEKSGNNTEKNVLQFNIDVNKNGGPLKAISAHLWIRVKKRRRSRSKGKKIFLKVSRIHRNDSGYEFLTRIRTRVKKSRWQKISLPITLVQSILDSSERTLKLRIECRKCGKVVRPVLSRRKSKHRRMRKSRRHQNRQRRYKRKKGNLSGYRSKRNDQTAPFLVTRYTHQTFKRHGS